MPLVKPRLHNQLQTAIFQLNIDCLYNVFDYLSLENIHSFGQTCKSFEQITGAYFRQNYVRDIQITDKHYIKYPGITKYPLKMFKGFDHFVQRLTIESSSFDGNLINIDSDCAMKLKEIRFRSVNLTGTTIQLLKSKLFKNVECMAIEYSTATRAFCNEFPKLLKNMQSLYIRDLNIWQISNEQFENSLLLQSYPKLEHLHWSRSKYSTSIKELYPFFELNSHVRSFGIDLESLCASKDIIIQTHMKFDDLTIDVCKHSYQSYYLDDYQLWFNVLCELHKRGIFKRLHLNFLLFNKEILQQMGPLEAIKSISLEHNLNDDLSIVKLPQLINLIELKVSDQCEIDHINVAKQVVNLERIYFESITVDGLMQFLRHSVKLKVIKIKHLEYNPNDKKCCNNILDLLVLNKARERLTYATKVTIFISETTYLTTKWSMKSDDFHLVEIRRESSYYWRHNFTPWI